MANANQMPFLRVRKPRPLGYLFGPFFWIGLGLAILYWFFDPLVHVLLVEEQRYLDTAFNPEAVDLARRTVTSLLLFSFGIISSLFFGRMRHAQAGLKESQTWLRMMNEASFEGLVVSEKGTVLAANPQAGKSLGYEHDELIGMTVAQLVAPKSQDEVIHNLAINYQETYVLTALRKDGDEVQIEVRGRNVDFEGRTLRVAAMWDITKQMETRRALRESEARFQILSEAAFEGIVLAKEGLIVDANEQMCKMMHTTRDKLLGRHVLDFATPESRTAGALALKTSDIMIFDQTLMRDDGTTIPVEVCTRAQAYGGELVGVAAVRDITERREAEEQLKCHERQLSTMAAQLALTEERVRRDIAVALHDSVAQQLSAARMKLGTIEDQSDGALQKDFELMRELIDESIRSTRSLVFDLSPPVLYELGFSAAIEWLADRLTERHGVACTVEDTGEKIEMEEDLMVTLYQLVRELMVNVTKHAQAKNASVAVGREDGDISIRVRDDGKGFDPTTAIGGFGLFSIRERLKSLGGELVIDSRPGAGTTATIRAPVQARAA